MQSKRLKTWAFWGPGLRQRILERGFCSVRETESKGSGWEPEPGSLFETSSFKTGARLRTSTLPHTKQLVKEAKITLTTA